MESLLNIEVAVQLAAEHEATLRRAVGPARRSHGTRMRRWLGRELLMAGTWLADDESIGSIAATRRAHAASAIGGPAVSGNSAP